MGEVWARLGQGKKDMLRKRDSDGQTDGQTVGHTIGRPHSGILFNTLTFVGHI